MFGGALVTTIEAPIARGIEFHPAVATWFRRRFERPTDAQTAGWPHIASGRDTLISAPTGSGKTFAAFLAGIDGLIRKAEAGDLEDVTEIVYVTPLKALGNDIQRNLETPLEEIRQVATELGYELPSIRTAVRSGDTPSSARQAMVRKPPHILITTPESLYLMVTAERSRENLRRVRTVIVDEIHALARDRRGSHLALTLARLDQLIAEAGNERPARIGLSATQRPIEEIAAFLVGTERIAADGTPDCSIVDLGHQRDIELAVELPPSELEAVASGEQWGEIYDRIAELIAQHRTTLVFVNTRRLSERVAHQLALRVGEEHVASHHGSLAKERRVRLEQRLKDGELRALVATASLELGIDIGSIDLVCQVGSPRGITTFLQRVGRSGHALGVRPKGRIFPASRDELVESAALIRAVHAGRLDSIVQPVAPLDVLAQQIVAECATQDWREDELYDLVRRATPYRDLSREHYDEVVEMLANGVGEGAGRSKPLIHRDRIGGVLRARRASRMIAIQNGGTIPELGDYRVIAEPDETVVGNVNEDWAIESMAGDVFLLGSTSWRIRRIESGTVRVEDARGAPPNIPFWLGEAPGRTIELSEEVGRLRREIEQGLDDREPLKNMLIEEAGVDGSGAQQLIDYMRATRDGLGLVPTDTDVVFERFFDESGGMQLVVHAPFGARINRAWGLALRKRFCVRFDFELQAAANDDGMILSLGPQHSFPLEEAFAYVTTRNVEAAVSQSCFYIPLFPTRWRWNTTRALAVPRRRGGKKVQPYLQRMIAADLLASTFPEQVGCQENVTGPLEMPDHVLLRQTMDDCLHEAMDVENLKKVLGRIEAGEIRLHARDTTEPSPMAHEIVNGKPYTYLDDAPLEERRTRAVTLRRSLPKQARDLGALDADAIARVAEQAWAEPRDAEEVHDALLSLVAVHAEEAAGWHQWLGELVEQGRAAALDVEGTRLWFAAEQLPAIALLYPDATPDRALELPEGAAEPCADREEARKRLLRGHSEVRGPFTPSALGARTGLSAKDAERGLLQLEAGGFVLRGRFTPGARRRRGRVLRPPAARAHPPRDPRPAAPRDRSRHRPGLHALPAALAARRPRHAARGARRRAPGRRAARRLRGPGRQLGAGPAARPRRGLRPELARRALPRRGRRLGPPRAAARARERRGGRAAAQRRLPEAQLACDEGHPGDARRARRPPDAAHGRPSRRPPPARAQRRGGRRDPHAAARARRAVLRRARDRHPPPRKRRRAGPARADRGRPRGLRRLPGAPRPHPPAFLRARPLPPRELPRRRALLRRRAARPLGDAADERDRSRRARRVRRGGRAPAATALRRRLPRRRRHREPDLPLARAAPRAAAPRGARRRARRALRQRLRRRAVRPAGGAGGAAQGAAPAPNR